MSLFNIVVLTPDEEIIKWLNSEIVEITETCTKDKLRSIELTYPTTIDDINFEDLFKPGNKIWIPESEVTDSCLYVINTDFKLDFWKENTITVSAEDIISELNYAELFSYANSSQITITRQFLEASFGKYYTIGEFNPIDSSPKIYPCGTMTLMSLLRYIESETGNVFTWSYEKLSNQNTIHRTLNFIKPSDRGELKNWIIDVDYNADNITYELDESDTYSAIAPVLELKESETSTESNTSVSSMTREDMKTVIDEWSDLEVSKGENIPMIVEKYNETTTDPETGQTVTEQKERVTAYWNAPFPKKSGELFVFDDTENDINYKEIKPKIELEHREENTVPKIGTVSTNDTCKYSIYDDCACKLIEKRYPSIEVSVDISNEDPKMINLYDTIYVRLRNQNKLLKGVVTKTVKNPHTPTSNKITVSNIDTGIRKNQNETYLEVTDFSCKELAGELFIGRLMRKVLDAYGNEILEPMADTDVTVTTMTNTGSVTTTSQTSAIVEETKETEVGYDKFGVSSDGTEIMAIGMPSSGADAKYSYTFWKSVFVNRCPSCGAEELCYGWAWGGEGKTGGTFPQAIDGKSHRYVYGRYKTGAYEGHIFCANCDADFSCVSGQDHWSSTSKNYLTRISGPESSSKDEARKLTNGEYMTVQEETVTSETTEPTTVNTNYSNSVKVAYVRKTDDNGYFNLPIALQYFELGYKLQCSYGGDIENARCSKTVNLTLIPTQSVVLVEPSTPTPTPTPSGGEVCAAISEVTGVTVTDIDSLYNAFQQTSYKYYYNDKYSRSDALNRIRNNQGLNCVDANQLAFYALKELLDNAGGQVRIHNGYVRCNSGSYGHIWCTLMRPGETVWEIFDASAAAKGITFGTCLCTITSWGQTNPSWLLSDDGVT